MIYNIEGNEVEIKDDTLRLVSILDLHLSPVTPTSRKDDFFQSTVDSFRQALRFAVKVKAHALVLAGDIFHLKTGSRNPQWFMRACILLFKEAEDAGIEVIGIAGNHDLTYGSSTSFETQPIGVLAAAGGIHMLDGMSVLYKMNGFTVRLAGCSFEHSKASPVRDIKKDGADILVSVGHFWFGKETGSFFGEPVYGPEYFKDSEADAFIIGHHHADQGIPVVNGKTFFVHGSINRIGAHAGDMERKPAVGLVEITKEGVKGQIARLKVPAAVDIFDVEQHKVILEERRDLDEFMELISNQVVAGIDSESILMDLALPAEVRKRVDQYLSAAEDKAA